MIADFIGPTIPLVDENEQGGAVRVLVFVHRHSNASGKLQLKCTFSLGLK